MTSPPPGQLLCARCLVERKQKSLVGYPEVAVTLIQGTAFCLAHVPRGRSRLLPL